MFWYYLFFLVLVLVAIYRDLFQPDERIFLLFAFCILFFVAGFREVYTNKDGENYVIGFESTEGPLSYFTNYNDWIFFEPFYYMVPSLLRLVFPELYIFLAFLLFAFLGVFLNLRGIYKLSYLPLVSVFVYFSHNFLLHEMTQIRVGVACGFLLLCTYYYYHKRYAAFFISVAVSVLFHYVSLLILLVLFLGREKFSRKLVAIILAVSMVLSISRSTFLIAPLLQLDVLFVAKLVKTLQAMEEELNQINIFNVAFLLNLALLSWLILKAKVIQEKNKYGNLIIKIHVLSVVLYLLFTSVSMIAFRLYEFFGIISVVSVPLVLYTFRNRIIGYSIITMYSLMILAINLHVAELLQPYSLYNFENLW